MTIRPTINTKAAVVGVLIIGALAIYGWMHFRGESQSNLVVTSKADAAVNDTSSTNANGNNLELSDSQLAAVKVEPVDLREFPVEKEAVGSIDFDEDMATQVFTPYQGKIISLFAEIGNDVKKGQTLFTIDSPDLLAADQI